jgi:hypothetical protein
MAALGGIVIDDATSRCHDCSAQEKAKYCLQDCLREDKQDAQFIACNDCHWHY